MVLMWLARYLSPFEKFGDCARSQHMVFKKMSMIAATQKLKMNYLGAPAVH